MCYDQKRVYAFDVGPQPPGAGRDTLLCIVSSAICPASQQVCQPCSSSRRFPMPMQNMVPSFLRQSVAARRPLAAVFSSCGRGGLAQAAAPACLAPRVIVCSPQQQQQQRAGLSTLRRGLAGPLSARLRLPMRGLEEFRDPEIIKVQTSACGCWLRLGFDRGERC